MVQQTVPTKRHLLYEMILKLSGLEKRVALTEQEIKEEVASIDLPMLFLPQLLGLSLGIDIEVLGFDLNRISLDMIEEFVS